MAVLPFENVGGDPETEYLSDGITESLIGKLAQVSNLKVMARSTVFRFKGPDIDPQQAGRDLNVSAVLTGRVSQRGDTLIVRAELMDVSIGTQLWGERFNRKMADIFSVEDEISRAITENLRVQLSREEENRLTRRYTASTEAYEAYLKGRYYWNKRTEEDVWKGIEYFHQANEKDPGYAYAYAGLADSYFTLGVYDYLQPKEAFPKAKAAAMRALELDDRLAEPHATLGMVKSVYDWDWMAARKELQRTIELNPRNAQAHHLYAHYLASMGRHDEAIAEIKRAQELEPLSLTMNRDVGVFYYFARRYDQAIEQLRGVIKTDPNYFAAHHYLGRAYAQKGMYVEGIAELEKAITLSGGYIKPKASLANVYGMAGQRGEALKILNELTELSKQEYVSSFEMAKIYAGIGESDRAFESLEKAIVERSSSTSYLKVDPLLDPLRSDPRFQDLLRRMNFPE